MKKEDTLKKTGKNRFVNMPILNSNAAGIDIGGSLHAVAVPIGRDDESVRTFGAMTCDLHEIANWLKKCNVDTVAMESTGVYWKPLFALLIHKGFEVYLVNAQHVRNVTGRKRIKAMPNGYSNYIVVGCSAVVICQTQSRSR